MLSGTLAKKPWICVWTLLAMLVVVVVARGAQHGGIDLGNAGHAGGNLEGRVIEIHGAATLSTVITTGTLELDISMAALSARCEGSDPSKGTSMFRYMAASRS